MTAITDMAGRRAMILTINTFFLALLLMAWVYPARMSHAATRESNGFVITDPLIPIGEILRGGPPRDGIPSIDKPNFVAADDAGFLAPEHQVLGLVVNGEARAYPILILNWHEIVNDEIAGIPVTVSYCPLCGTGTAFRRAEKGFAGTFGVSGLLYNSDLLLYDRASESLWSQVTGQAVSGPRKGELLKSLPLEHTTWQDWRKRHPTTLALSTDTGFRRDYSRSPYGNYDENGAIYFPVSFRSQAFHPKERVLGIEIDGHYKAYPFVELAKTKSPLRDTVADKNIVIEFNAETRNGIIRDAEGNMLAGLNAFWFAWYTFHPDSEVFRHQP